MGLKGKLISQVDIKGDGNIVHEIFKDRPNDLSIICPDIVHSVNLVHGEWGTVGCVVDWKFILDGKESVSREKIEAIDNEKRALIYTALEGDLMKLYNTFQYFINIDTNGDHSTVTWALEYEKKNANVPDPHKMMDLCLAVTKIIENHNLAQAN